MFRLNYITLFCNICLNQELPLLASIQESTVKFSNGEERTIDAIIMCTGYQMRQHFLQKSLRLESPNSFYPDGLYKGIVLNENPRVLYLGMQVMINSICYLLNAQTCHFGTIPRPIRMGQTQNDRL